MSVDNSMKHILRHFKGTMRYPCKVYLLFTIVEYDLHIQYM